MYANGLGLLPPVVRKTVLFVCEIVDYTGP